MTAEENAIMCNSRLPVSIPDAGSLSYMQAACRDCPLTNISDLLMAVSAVLSCCHGCSPSAQPQSFLSSYKTAEVDYEEDYETVRPLTYGLCRTMGGGISAFKGPFHRVSTQSPYLMYMAQIFVER